MKSKILFLLTSFLMLVLGTGSSYAEVGDVLTTLDQISNSKYYTITAPRGGLVLNSSETGVVSKKKSGGSVDNAEASTEADADKWAILSHDGVSYYLYNVKNKKVLNADGSMSPNLSEALELMLATNPDGNYMFKIKKGDNTLNNNNSGGFLLDSWSTEDAGNRLTIVEAGDFDASILDNLSSITFSVLDGSGNIVATETIERCIKGVTYSSQYASFKGVTLANPSVEATGENKNVTTSFTIDESAFPFKFSADTQNGPSWYMLKVNRSTPKYCTFDGTSIKTSTDLTETSFSKKTAFCFVGTPFGFKIVNALHKDMAFGPKEASANAVLSNTSVDNAATFVFENGTEAGYESNQLLRNITDPVGYVNDINGELAYWLSTYNRRDPGSNFSFIEVPTEAIDLPSSLTIDGIKYLLNDDEKGVTVTYPCDEEPTTAGMNTYEGDIVIPDFVDYNGTLLPVTAIGRAAFCRSGITSLTIGDNVKETGYDCCAYTATLTKAVLGTGIAHINQGFGWSCGKLTDVTIKAATPPTVGNYIFSANPTITVKITSLPAYKAASGLSGYTYSGTVEGFDFTYAELQTLADAYDNKYTSGDAPGFMSEASVQTIQNAVDASRSVSESAETATINAAVKAIADAINDIKAVDFVDGKLYYVVSAGNGPGYSGGPYNYEYKNALYNANGFVSWKAWNKDDVSQMYKFTSAADGKWYLYCVGDNTYMNKGLKGYACKVSTSDTPVNAQAFTLVGNYNGKFAFTGETYAYALNGTHNGSAEAAGDLNVWGSISEAANYGVNQWFVCPVAEDLAEKVEAKNALVAYYNQICENYEKMTDPSYDDIAFTVEQKIALGDKLDDCKTLLNGTGTAEDYNNMLAGLKEVYEAVPFVEGGRKSSSMVVGDITNGSKIILEVGHPSYRGKYMVAYPANANGNSVMCDDNKSLATVWQLEATGATDAIYTDKPTYYMKDLASGKYLGATSLTSVNPGDKRMVDGTENALPFSFLTKEEIKAQQNVDLDTYNTENPVFVHHSNADGTWLRLSRFGTYTYLYYISSSAYPGNKDWQTWELHSGNSNYTISEELADVIEEYGNITFPNVGSDPGCFDSAAVKPFNDAVAAAKAITSSNTRQEFRTAIDNLKGAYEAILTATVNPVTDGYYYIESAWTSKAGQHVVAYDPNDGSNMLKNHANTNSAYDIFQLTTIGDGQYALKNLGSGLYVGQAIDANRVTLVESMTEGVYQTFTYDTNGEFRWKDNKTGFTYYITDDWIGRYYRQATSGGFDAWYLRSVPQEVIDEFDVSANYYEIATEPSEPVEGKTYVIKSVTNGLYATSKGATEKVSALGNDAIWSIENIGTHTGDGGEIDLGGGPQYAKYYLKSVANDGFWQAEDFTAGAEEGSPWDGYDTHKYAGLNAYFGDYDNAQEFTILPATAYSEEETNSSVGKDKTPKGYVIATAEKVTSGTFSKYYKLDTQRGTDVALDPYQADVDWFFYEATKGTDINRELEIAKETYKFDTDGVVTGTAPGFYNSDNIAAYNAAYAAAAALTPESPKADVRKAIDALADAYAKAIVVNPIVEGYYAIVSAGKGSGYPFSDAVKYDDEDRYALYNSDGIVSWKTYDESAYDEIYYFSQSADGNWYVRSLIDNTYMNRGTGSYNCKITTSAEAVTSQEFIASDVVGKFVAKFNGNPYVYALTSSHNGSNGNTTGTLNIWGSAAEANKGKMNLWYLRSVSAETVTRAKESIVAGIDDLIAEIEGKNLEGSTLPGYYSQANVDALATALAAAKNLGESTVDEKLSAINTLKASYNKTLTELNPITEGYYYLVSKYKAFNDKFGSPAAMYIAPGQQLTSGFYAARYEVFDENNANFIFKLTPKDGVADGFYAQSAYCGKYLNTGDGNTWYGEVTNASDAAVNAQLFKNYALGQYWVADETDTRVSRCVRKNGTNNGTIYGWTQIGDVVSEADAGYNAWELLPVTAEEVSAIIEAQNAKDESASRKFDELTGYVNEIQGTYDSYTSDASELSSDLKDALKAAYKQFTDARSARPYDITSTDATYQAIQSNLQELMATARLEMSGVDGIAAGGNGTVNATNGGVAVTAEADMTLNIFNASGVLVTKQSLKAGDSVNVSLAPGVYVVNGKKMLVK